MGFERDSEHHARWRRIAAHPLGGDDERFAARVADTNGWTRAQAQEAITEYRRFVFLACLGEEVTPSKAVDAVWHEHLVHTRDYWLEFCPYALGMSLHHAPGGAPQDEARFAAQYARTLREYARWFGEPPSCWWPRRTAPGTNVRADAAPDAPRNQAGFATTSNATVMSAPTAPRSFARPRRNAIVATLRTISARLRSAAGIAGLHLRAGDALARIAPRAFGVERHDVVAATRGSTSASARSTAGLVDLHRRTAVTLGLIAIPALAWAATRPSNPLDWTGPEFLVLYLALLLGVMIASPLLRRRLRARAGDVRDAGNLSTLEAAYLAGGVQRAVDAGAAELHRRDALRWDAQSRRFEVRDAGERLDAPLRGLADAFSIGSADAALRRAQDAIEPVRRTLEQRGLYLRREDARRIGRWSALPAFALLLFGVAKIVIGMQRDRPVTVLVILCIVTAIYAVAMLPGGTAKPTRAGELALARKRAAQRATRNGRFDDIGLAVALGGTTLLAGTAMAGYHELRAPRGDSSTGDSSSSSSGSSDSDSGSGSDSGGSSCGGCGGGGD